jgi:L,D-peptidoglycan transpeptidase YkuD (ErfK/YbiS/YcfS/YnhG family)
VVSGLAARHPAVGQFVVVRTTGWAEVAAVVDVVARDGDGAWRCQRGSQAAMVGRTGVRTLLARRSGDGTTPAGVFPLGVATAWDGQRFSFFGNRPDPGVRGTYRRVRPEDCWGATPGDPAYNHLVRWPGCPGPDDEWLPRFGEVYAHAALIGANTEPEVSGDVPGEPAFAAAIFLHRHAYRDGDPRPTSGCVSLALTDLTATLHLLDPSRDIHFAIGPADWLRETA